MITTLTDGLNPLPAIGNSKLSRSARDASATNFADAMQNLSTEREPASSSVVDEDSVSLAVSQEDALSSEQRDEPDPNELQHAMDESTIDMIKSGQLALLWVNPRAHRALTMLPRAMRRWSLWSIKHR